MNNDEFYRKQAMKHRQLAKAHRQAYLVYLDCCREEQDADAEQAGKAGLGGSATAAPDVPELGQ